MNCNPQGGFVKHVTRNYNGSNVSFSFYLLIFTGPFSVIIATLPKDFMKIAVVYIILYVPMVCVFFHFFAGPYDKRDLESDDFNESKYSTFEQTCFTGETNK